MIFWQETYTWDEIDLSVNSVTPGSYLAPSRHRWTPPGHHTTNPRDGHSPWDERKCKKGAVVGKEIRNNEGATNGMVSFAW